jgi:hypothetical protein
MTAPWRLIRKRTEDSWLFYSQNKKMLFITTAIWSTWYPVSGETKVFCLLSIFTEMGVGITAFFIPISSFLKSWVEKFLTSLDFLYANRRRGEKWTGLAGEFLRGLESQERVSPVMPGLAMSHAFYDTTVIGNYRVCQPLKSRQESHIRSLPTKRWWRCL